MNRDIDVTQLPFLAKLLDAGTCHQVNLEGLSPLMILNLGQDNWSFFFDYSPSCGVSTETEELLKMLSPQHYTRTIGRSDFTILEFSGTSAFGDASIHFTPSTIATALGDVLKGASQ